MEKKDITLTIKYKDRDIIKRTLKLMKPEWWRFLIGFLLVLLTALLNIALPYVNGKYTDIINANSASPISLNALIFVCVAYLVLVILNAIFSFLSNYILQVAGQNIIFKLRQEVFEAIENFSHEQLSEIPVGKLVTRVTNDTNALNELYSSVLVQLIQNILTLLGMFIMMVYLNPYLSLFELVVISLVVVATIIYRHFSRIAFSNARKQVSNLNIFLSENLSLMKITQVYNKEEAKREEFKKVNTKVLESKFQLTQVFAFYRPLISIFRYVTVGLIFLFGVRQVMNNSSYFNVIFTFGSLTAYYTYNNRLFGPIENLSEQFDKLQSGIIASERIFNILDMKSTLKEMRNHSEIDHFKGKIEFRNVWFKYSNSDWILKDVSFVIEPKQTLALVGATGAGKTTILSLITRNYDIQKGEILIDDINILDIDLGLLRRKIGEMLQDVFLFSGSIKDNITLFNDSIPNEEIENAIKYVNTDSFINKMNNGLDTLINEKGTNISNGERQLISFARTILSKPEILILDEATSNIDTETEVLIQDSLEKMKNIGTMIIVAHRLSTIQHADKILCLKNGEIVETGNHQELLRKHGYYYKLYTLQLDKLKNSN